MDCGCHSAAASCQMQEMQEKAVIAGLWRNAQILLTCSHEDLTIRIRQLQDQLPAVHHLEPAEAGRLALLHVNSATSMMQTMRLATPHIYANDTAFLPDFIGVLQMVDYREMQLVLALIELQLFNLKRAEVLVARAREELLHGTQFSCSSCATSVE